MPPRPGEPRSALSSSSPQIVSGSSLDFDDLSLLNGLHSISISDVPKLEQFPLITTNPINGLSSVHSPPPNADLVKSTARKTKMPTLIRHFRGVQDNLEDPDEYIEDLEWAYSQDFQSAEPTNNIEAKQMYTNKTYRILFRNNLEGRAVECYSNLGAPIRKDWDLLKSSFLEYFKLVLQDSQTKLWERKVELANLRQGRSESNADFLKRAEHLARQIPNSEVDVGMAIIQGMSDENEKKRISFECHKDSDFTFLKVKKLIRAAFFEVGKTSLFDSTCPAPFSSASPPTSDEALRQMVISASTSLPSILQGMRSIGTALQNLNRVPVPPQPAARSGVVQRAYKTNRDLSDIRCFTCGQMGHYASAHREPDAQQPWASGALFPKDDSGPEVEVQGKLATMVEEDDGDVMLTAPVTLHDSGVKKRQPKKAAKPVVKQRQLRAIYEDP
ncbi:hypothetical protein MMC31_005123 [Peltigera leucophlebia]|nr:hypothetical protein [Peltigera leucophlebia]